MGLNQKEFAALGGATLDSQSRYETGKNQPAAEYLARLGGNGVDVHYVLTGERAPESDLSAEESELVRSFRRLARRDRDVVLHVIERMASPHSLNAPIMDYRGPEEGCL